VLLNVFEQYSFKGFWVNSVVLTIFMYLFLILYILFSKKARKKIKFYFRWGFVWLFYFQMYQNFINMRFDRFCLILIFLFIVIFWFNMLSTWTFTYSLTGIFCFTTILTACLIIWIVCVTSTRVDIKTFSNVTPQGIPGNILKSLVSIEGVSFWGRLASLNIRLFINIVSGHLILKSVFMFLLYVWVLFQGGSLFIINAITTCILIASLFCLEIFVSILQAYIFMFLVTIYLQESVW